MREAVTETQWASARELAEGQAPTHTRIAAAMGVHFSTVSHRAAEAEWQGLDFRHKAVRVAHGALVHMAARAAAGLPLEEEPAPRAEDLIEIGASPEAEMPSTAVIEADPDEDPEERLMRMGEMIAAQSDRLISRSMVTGRPPERSKVNALLAMTQPADRLADHARSFAIKRSQASDAELAAILEKIDDRIHYQALHFAVDIMREHGIGEDILQPLTDKADAIGRRQPCAAEMPETLELAIASLDESDGRPD